MLALACAAALFPAQAQTQTRRGALVRIPFPYVGKVTPYSFRYSYAFTALVYDTLLLRDEDGVPRPWLARSVRTSDDGLRVTVRLAAGARWHDGKPVTAQDVAFTLRYMRTRPHPRFEPQLRAIAGVRVLARDRLVIRLRQRSPGFADQPLADVPILPRHIWAQVPADAVPRGLPVGSGPYRVVRQSRQRLPLRCRQGLLPRPPRRPPDRDAPDPHRARRHARARSQPHRPRAADVPHRLGGRPRGAGDRVRTRAVVRGDRADVQRPPAAVRQRPDAPRRRARARAAAHRARRRRPRRPDRARRARACCIRARGGRRARTCTRPISLPRAPCSPRPTPRRCASSRRAT